MVSDERKANNNFISKISNAVMGAPKQLKDPHLFHKMSLIPVLAWIGRVRRSFILFLRP